MAAVARTAEARSKRGADTLLPPKLSIPAATEADGSRRKQTPCFPPFFHPCGGPSDDRPLPDAEHAGDGWHWLSEPDRRYYRSQVSRRAEPVCGGDHARRSLLKQTEARHPAFHPSIHPYGGPSDDRPLPDAEHTSGDIIASAVTYACHRYPTAAGLACGPGSGKITAVLASERRAITFSCAVFSERPHGALSGRGRGSGHCPHTEGLPHGRLRSS